MIREAVLDSSEKYRYSLIREWDTSNLNRAVFIMLNPSTAYAYEDDYTTNRCISFAKTWGCGSLEIVNLFGYRATNFNELTNLTKMEAIGKENELYIKRALNRASMIVAAWGENCKLHNRKKDIRLLLSGYELKCLGETKSGYPRHPSRIPNDASLRDYKINSV